jgi:hypothetical protein
MAAKERVDALAKELFLFDDLGSAQAAVARILDDSATQAVVQSIEHALPPDPPFAPDLVVPPPLAAHIAIDRTALVGTPEAVAGAIGIIDGSRRAAVDRIYAELLPATGTATVDVRIDALAVDPTAAQALGAQASLDALEKFLKERPRLGPVLAASAALRPKSATSVRLWAMWSHVTLRLEGVTDQDASDLSTALLASPSLEGYKAPAVALDGTAHTIDFVSKH